MSKIKKTVSLRILSWSGFVFGLIGASISIMTYFSSANSLELQRQIEADRTSYEAMDLLLFKSSGAGKLYWYIERGKLLSSDEDRARLERARRKIATLEQLDPDRPELTILKFSYYAQFGDEEGLKKILYTEIGPAERTSSLMLIAAFLANLKESPEAAAPYYNEAIKIEPNNPEIYRAYGVILHSFGKNDESIAQLKISDSLAPNNTEIINDLAHVLSESDQQDTAERMLIELIKNNLANARTYNSLGMFKYYSRQYKKAEEMYIKALELNPNYGLYHKNISLTYAKLGKTDEAERHLRLAAQDGTLSKEIMDSEHVHH